MKLSDDRQGLINFEIRVSKTPFGSAPTFVNNSQGQNMSGSGRIHLIRHVARPPVFTGYSNICKKNRLVDYFEIQSIRKKRRFFRSPSVSMPFWLPIGY
jgi:hypothetical protein